VDARIWEQIQLTDIMHMPDGAGKLLNQVLPRWGSHIRELSLCGTYVGDGIALLRAVVNGCPYLRYLDVRDCYGAFRLCCDPNETSIFDELLLVLYERALPSEHFTLLLSESSFADGCYRCGERCDGYVRRVTNSLALISSWPVKSSAQDAAVAPTTAWLRCDLAAVCTNWGADDSHNCDLFIENPLQPDGIPAARRADLEAEDCCDCCKELTCKVRSSGVGLTALALSFNVRRVASSTAKHLSVRIASAAIALPQTPFLTVSVATSVFAQAASTARKNVMAVKTYVWSAV
jgi:hypothetical protein